MKNLLRLLALIAVAASTMAQPATLSTVTPASGLTSGSDYVHIHGTNLIGLPLTCPVETCFSFVKFGSLTGTIVDLTSSEVVVVAPPHAAGVVDVQVNVPGKGTLTIAGGYRYQDAASTDLVRLLVPVAISGAGAFGTNWRTELFVNNANTQAVALTGAFTSSGTSVMTIPVFSTASVTLVPPAGNAGAFLYVPKRLIANVTASLRVHDTTRDGDSWGTDVPVVPETQFKRFVILVGVPADSRYRTLLRVYGYNALDTPVRIDISDDATGEALATREALLLSGLSSVGPDAPTAPSYAQIALDPLLAPFAATHPRIHLEVTSTFDPPPPLWAFVSITNNTTQQVTTVTPGMSHPTPPSVP
jgi:hypothetical protein